MSKEKKYQRGHLILKDNGRYSIVIKELTCGFPIEAFINGKLIKGTIEGRINWENGGEHEYYLLGDDNKAYSLKNDIEVLFEE